MDTEKKIKKTEIMFFRFFSHLDSTGGITKNVTENNRTI